MPEQSIVWWIGQAVGFVAIIVAFISFQVKSRGGILVLQGIANGVWAVHFIMIGAPAGAIMNALCFIRNLVYAKKTSWKWVNSLIVPILFCSVAVTISVITNAMNQSWIDYIILPSTVVSSLAYYLNDERTIRASTLFVSGSWLVFNIIKSSYSGIFAEVFNLTSVCISLFRYRKVKSSDNKNVVGVVETAQNSEFNEEKTKN
jgi:hypothetical protein